MCNKSPNPNTYEQGCKYFRVRERKVDLYLWSYNIFLSERHILFYSSGILKNIQIQEIILINQQYYKC